MLLAILRGATTEEDNVDPVIVWIAIAVVAILVIGFIAMMVTKKTREEKYKKQFGSEYDRTVKSTGSRSDAEHELKERAARVETYEIRPLTASDRQRFTSDWEKIQADFVDRPTIAVMAADELINSVLRARGYPMADFETQAADLSVKHPRVVDKFRHAHGVTVPRDGRQPSTEDLRRAMVEYRELFDELVSSSRDVEMPRDDRYERDERPGDRRRDDDLRIDDRRPRH
jgi:hypothetical protein